MEPAITGSPVPPLLKAVSIGRRTRNLSSSACVADKRVSSDVELRPGMRPRNVVCRLLNGESGVGLIDRFDASEFPTRFAAQIRNFDDEK